MNPSNICSFWEISKWKKKFEHLFFQFMYSVNERDFLIQDEDQNTKGWKEWIEVIEFCLKFKKFIEKDLDVIMVLFIMLGQNNTLLIRELWSGR